MSSNAPSAELALMLTTRLRQQNRDGLEALKSRFFAGLSPGELLQERSAQVDALLSELWDAQQFPDDLALIAVGGYGRCELYPCSDVDLLILLPEPASELLAGQLQTLIGQLWDAGLEVGHSVRTIDECLTEADGDVSVRTALLETRWIAGDSDLFQRFQHIFLGRLDARDFYRAKLAEQDERYRKHNETPYNLEPDCKESPGGLRDLHVIIWLARGSGSGSDWNSLFERGMVTGEEVRRLKACEAFLRDLRIRLHFHAGRRQDRLIFDVQGALAAEMGFKVKNDRRASERMMQAYYKNAKTVTQLNTLVLQTIGLIFLDEDAPSPQPIDDAFQIRGRMLDLVRPGIFGERPSRLLEAFQHSQDFDLQGMTTALLRELWHAGPLIDAAFRADLRNRELFLGLLKSDNGLILEFRRMNQWGILGRYLPVFNRIVGQMQHDLFHVYTVDQHILQVMRNLRRFTMVEHAHEYPFESRLMSGFDRPWVLYVAALFHDIAKGRGGNHSVLGKVDARKFCADHSIGRDDAELIVWLVGEHLTFSKIAQTEDITDPDVLGDFSARMRDERHLTALYLLTVADIRGTSPKVWNGWKAQLLAGLYQGVLNILRTDHPAEVHGVIELRQQEAIRILRFFALPDSIQHQLWRNLDTAYFARHSADEIAWHTRALHYRLASTQPVVKARLYRPELNTETGNDHEVSHDLIAAPETHDHSGIQVMVYTPDQADLFLRLVGFFSRAGFSIADAKIYTTRNGFALDSFVLLDVQNRASDRNLIAFIEYELSDRLNHLPAIDQPISGRLSREVRHFPFKPVVQMWPDDSGKKYFLSVVAADRAGLLYTVAEILAGHGITVETAKIATLGERVEDVFLIRHGKLSQSAFRLKLETELTEALKV